MRRAIDTAPRDGKFVILEDDVSGSFELAQWSAEARAWVKENGELSKITPTHWQTTHLPKEGDEFILQDEFIPQKEIGVGDPSASPRTFLFPSGLAARARATELTHQVANADSVTVARLEARAEQAKSERGPRARRWFAVSSIAAAMVAASLIGLYFHAELAAYVTRYTGEQDNVRIGTVGVEVIEQETQVPNQDSQIADSLARDPALHQQADRASSRAPRDTAQVKQGAEAMRPEAQQPLEKERRRAEALANELAKAQQVIETQVALASKARDQAAQLSQAAESGMAELRQSLQKEHDRAEALAGELAKVRRDIETQLALPSKARDQAAERHQAAEKATASLRQSLKTEHDRAEALTGELAKARRDLETQLARSTKAGDEAAQEKKAAESATAELRQSLQKEHDRAEALTGELAMTRRNIETQLALSGKAGEEAAQVTKAAESARLSLQKEHDRAEALTSELARAQRDIETQVALASKAGDEAAQLKQHKEAAESATAELRLSLQKEHERAEALTSELARARRDIETQVALASKAGDEAAQLKQHKEAAESATAELRQSLQKERDRVQALAPGREPTQPTIGARIEVERVSNSQIAQVTQAAEAAATEQPAAAEAQGIAEAARLLARASALVGQGNIGAARIVLERAVETGSAQASFMLAETYDPLVLSTWKTYGTRGDVTKARELYARALAGGIQEAKDRSVALR
ncbi:hypothetical protein [Bradyrhizobium sp. JYMT SZCCT0428]|uniref:hypothetical protein n=1 Tax=Bradyrhizobium sp. JYMT SZCCT0428 TaxID=2807673 RepID=UPI001BAA43D4|nr:hypothetical protein [Bradyrhizobium sp. JYMT SZCCT0428]MBR1155268.1 hypothetical protein [Bradyrhizobium sp. JYMT SZCCT0428]